MGERLYHDTDPDLFRSKQSPRARKGRDFADGRPHGAGRASRNARAAHLVFTLPPSRSHILWLVGHMAVSLDRISAMALGVPFVLPESYAPLFGMGSQPVADAAAYPPFGELSEALARALEAAVGRFRPLPTASWPGFCRRACPSPKSFPRWTRCSLAAAFPHVLPHRPNLAAAPGPGPADGVWSLRPTRVHFVHPVHIVHFNNPRSSSQPRLGAPDAARPPAAEKSG